MTKATDKCVVRLRDDGRRPRFRQIQDFVLHRIATGSLKPGEQLPPLRLWAAEVGVAYETMSKAIRELVAKGVLESRPRWGTRVASRGGTRRRTGAVGVLSAGMGYDDFLRHSRFYSAIMPLVQNALSHHHERVIFERWTPETVMAQTFRHLNLVDGLLLLGNVEYPVEEILAVEQLGIPVVLLGTEIVSPDVHIVRSDDVADTREAVRRLHAMGHRVIAAWTDPRDPRYEGYRAGLAECGAPLREELVVRVNPPETVAEEILKMAPRPTALLIMRHMDRVGAMAGALARHGIQPGRDIYFCIYDEDLWHTFLRLGAPYARIEQPIAEIAQAAATVLLERIEGRYRGPAHLLLRSAFVEMPAR